MNGDAKQAAHDYLGRGWQPVPAPLRGKFPRGQWKRFQTERATPRDVDEGFARPANVFLITGSISQLCVLDCDDEKSLAYWAEQLGDDLELTTAVKTGNGWHFYFGLEKGEIHRNQSVEDEASGKWDIRAEGGGVVAPPSVHESGRIYEWHRGPECLRKAPEALWERESATGQGGPDNARSLLTHLLQNPPSQGNRNSWLSRVAGHYAKHIPHEDAFAQMVWDANSRINPPLEDEEVEKLISSIWSTERAKAGKAVKDIEDEEYWRKNLQKPSEDNGFLVSGGYHILAQTRVKKEEGYVYGLGPWLDCDIRVLGIIDSEHDRQYSVQLRFPDDHIVEDHVSSAIVADSRECAKWLARHGASIGPPDTIWPVRYPPSTRLMRYLGSQNALPMEAAEALGWHKDSEAFITHDGVIRKGGEGPFEHVRPDPALRKWAPYQYGHRGVEEAQRVLAEVLTFHDATVASVFGAWWASVLLKPQIQERASQFPFMAIEAPSESGKTKGFFPLMIQLSGNRAGQMNPTRAALRDYLSGHSNGIVWVDDLDSLEEMGELLRQVTVGGSIVKKSNDNVGQVVATMRSALVVSGESLGLRDQKALIDRAIALRVSTPMGRMSVKDPTRPQWDDIVELMDRYPDLTEFAGSLVELALGQTEWVTDLKKLRVGAGRHADAMAILRVGARVLRGMLGDLGGDIVEKVDEFATQETKDYTGRENALTLKMLPMALANTGWLGRPEPPDDIRRKVATPVFVDEEDVVWFSPSLLSQWWVREPKSGFKIVERTESQKALEDQARELGLGGKKGSGRKDFKLQGTQKSMRYWCCTHELSAILLERSRGVERNEDDGSDQGQLIGD